MKINVNQRVRVRLSTVGHDIHRRHYSQPIYRSYPPPPIKEDADGWSEWQLWTLMQVFGASHYMGAVNVPFIGNEIDFPDLP